MLYLLLTLALCHCTLALVPENVNRCEACTVDTIRKMWDSEPPKDILKRLGENIPWATLFITRNFYRKDMQSVIFNLTNSRITPKVQGAKVVKSFNLTEENGILSDGNLKVYVMSYDDLAFTFYVCDMEGKEGEYPQAGVAVALGPPGGVPAEVLDAAKQARKLLWKIGAKPTTTLKLY